MKSFFKYFCLYLIVFVPLTIQAKLIDQVIFRPSGNSNNELWMTDIWDTQNAYRIYKHSHIIWDFAVQKDGQYIIFNGGHGLDVFEDNVYLFDRFQPDKEVINLTHRGFEVIWDLDISINGDIIFTNLPAGDNPFPKIGIFLIPHSEIHKGIPNIKLVNRTSASEVVWAPDGEQIAYINREGVFTYDIATRQFKHVSNFAISLSYSPDGRELAYRTHQDILISSLNNPQNRKIITTKDRNVSGNIKWSPDRKYIFYRTAKKNYAAPVNGGAHIEIFIEFDRGVSFDWTNSVNLSVEPKDKLATLWGKLKQ